MAKKVENKSFGAAAAAIKKEKLEAEAAIRGQLKTSELDKVKVNLSLILLHFVLQGQTCLLFQVSLDFLLLHSNPL